MADDKTSEAWWKYASMVMDVATFLRQVPTSKLSMRGIKGYVLLLKEVESHIGILDPTISDRLRGKEHKQLESRMVENARIFLSEVHPDKVKLSREGERGQKLLAEEVAAWGDDLDGGREKGPLRPVK